MPDLNFNFDFDKVFKLLYVLIAFYVLFIMGAIGFGLYMVHRYLFGG